MEILTYQRQHMKNHLLEVGAWTGFFTYCISPEALGYAAGLASLFLSVTGIIKNLIEIKKTNKKP